MIHIFSLMEIFGSKECNIMANAARDREREHIHTCSFTVSLYGSLPSFQEELSVAVMKLALQAKINKHIIFKRQKRLKPETVQRTRKYILQAINVPQKTIEYLIKHPGIIDYSNDQIVDLTNTIGAQNMSRDLNTRALSLEEALDECACTKNSLLKCRVDAVARLINFVTNWEADRVRSLQRIRYHDDDRRTFGDVIDELHVTIVNLRNLLEEKDAKIKALTFESDVFKSKIQDDNDRKSILMQTKKVL
mmetsp:Transcript_898/g.1367  ORF Transcript_898/g.1367 Transcript_898/m.1367 type:complete len:249 (-) Transcript_898:325-1071(-)